MRVWWRRHLLAIAGYILVAILFSWPLPLHLQTHLPGPPDEDTGVYVWNLWVFQHEVLEHRTLPYFTEKIFAATGPANLSLHNYTAFANVLALPFVQFLGVVATFNVVYLVLTLCTGYAMFLLAGRLTSDSSIAWLSGVLFAWSPVLVTRGMGHFSLVAAAPLPIFVLMLLRTNGHPSWRDGLSLGTIVAWATACDVYYGVFCIMVGVAYLAVHGVRVTRSETVKTSRTRIVPRAIDVGLICLCGLVLALLIGKGWEISLLGQVVRIQTLYTPMLALTILAVARLAVQYRPIIRPISPTQVASSVRMLAATAMAAAILMSPLLFAFTLRVLDGRMASSSSSRVFWRSSPPGTDAAALLVPNPNHPLAPAAFHDWIAQLTRPDYVENVASISFVALATIVVARWFGWQLPTLPAAIALGFGLLALGPFVRIAGVQTYVPGPWALLRYVPVIGMVRSPGRFMVFAMVGFAALFAGALGALAARWPGLRRPIIAGVAALLLAELLPAPRRLFSAEIPSIYRIVTNDPRDDVRVLELPFGIRDGTMNLGNFSARTQFYQTAHHKPILGGYVSRVSQRRVRENRRHSVLSALIRLSERKSLSAQELDALRRQWPGFAQETSIGYVIVDRARGAPELNALPGMLGLERLGEAGELTLYRPAQ